MPDDEEAERILNEYQEASEAEDPQAIEAAALSMLEHASEQATEEPNAYLQAAEAAANFANAGDWSNAEATYQQALTIAESQNLPGRIFKAYEDLSQLYSLLNREEEALAAAYLALEAAKNSEITHLHAMALQGIGICLLRQSRDAEALQYTDEQLRILPNKAPYKLARARALVVRARCYIRQNQIARAEQDLADAWPILEPMAEAATLAGYQSGLASWWEADAEIKRSRRDLEGAAASLRQAVERRRIVSQCSQLEGPYRFASLARTLNKLGNALTEIGDTQGAKSLFSESQVIERLTGLPPSPPEILIPIPDRATMPPVPDDLSEKPEPSSDTPGPQPGRATFRTILFTLLILIVVLLLVFLLRWSLPRYCGYLPAMIPI